ncbi:hypothetical protein DUNSADRAFT_6131 [Dunaliella salina]|uniref:Encoded protein n=1 Tax=Dunaliella salina TaxID=3046 RepID=A0ABQ7GNY1_DUNSA|nr:hypothetical protein DUNSADRAFT_6131 [Dunaliella salina]|eukprot:KAF5836301.1 hypothetical protein DUNSADRAFT_6131 [Dunaliella salina]
MQVFNIDRIKQCKQAHLVTTHLHAPCATTHNFSSNPRTQVQQIPKHASNFTFPFALNDIDICCLTFHSFQSQTLKPNSLLPFHPGKMGKKNSRIRVLPPNRKNPLESRAAQKKKLRAAIPLNTSYFLTHWQERKTTTGEVQHKLLPPLLSACVGRVCAIPVEAKKVLQSFMTVIA